MLTNQYDNRSRQAIEYQSGGGTLRDNVVVCAVTPRSDAARRRVRSACVSRPPLRRRHYKSRMIPRNLWEHCQRHPH